MFPTVGGWWRSPSPELALSGPVRVMTLTWNLLTASLLLLAAVSPRSLELRENRAMEPVLLGEKIIIKLGKVKKKKKKKME